MRVTRVGQDSTLAAVSRLLERARASRPRVADVADRVAAWFVGAVLLLALVVGLYWLRVDPTRAFPTVLAVLVVTCPCALSLATPAALAAATTRLARCGLLVTRGRALERLARADRIVFDKTGTLTRGQPRIEQVRLLRRARRTRRAASRSPRRWSATRTHPIARAFAQIEPAAAVRRCAPLPGAGFRQGSAACAIASAAPTMSAKAARARRRRSCPPRPIRRRGSVVLGDESGAAGGVSAGRQRARATRAQTLERLRGLGVEPLIASGDRSGVRRRGRAPARSIPRERRFARRRTSWRWCAHCRRAVIGWRWSATASTMLRCSPAPTCRSPSAAAPIWQRSMPIW